MENLRKSSALVTDAPAIVIGWIAREIGIDVDDLPARQDHMGQSIVYY